MKVIIAGSRDITLYSWIKVQVDLLLTYHWDISTEIVSGGAMGVDQLGERYAKEKNLELKKFSADWETYGKGAGYIRNEEMAKYGDMLVAFWDGKSRGTKHMIDMALKYKLDTHIYIEDESTDKEDESAG